MVKNVPANTGDVGLISELGISSGEETATHSSILAWRIPWTEEPGGYSPGGCKQSPSVQFSRSVVSDSL